MGVKFEGCVLYVYDLSGKMLVSSVVTAHNILSSLIEIEHTDAIVDNEKYKLLILTTPAPHTYSCVAEDRGQKTVLKLFHGEMRELRSNERYPITGTVDLFAYLDDGKEYELLSALTADLINISKGGIRFKMKRNSLSKDDVVRIRFNIEGPEKVLNVCVVNQVDVEGGFSEYGCRLVGG